MSGRWEGNGLLEPITADQPCGENLEDSPVLASFDTFRVFGQPIPLDTPPDTKNGETRKAKPPDSQEWVEIRDQAIEALAKSKDLRLLAYLGSALLRTDGLPAFFETLKVASHWLDTYWDATYPLVDEDAVIRRNALNCFADQMAVIDGLRRLPLVSDRQLGRFSLRDIEIATGQAAPSDGQARPDEAQINAAFAAMPLDELQGLRQSLTDASAALKSIDAKMQGEAGPDASPGFESLSAQLAKVDRVLRAQLAARPDAQGVEAIGSDAEPGAKAAVGPIKSRQDAIRALDAVADFFRQTEPSSPLPLIVERAKRLVSKSFLEVLADVAPSAVSEARAAGGLKDGE